MVIILMMEVKDNADQDNKDQIIEVDKDQDHREEKTHNALSAELMETAFQIQTPSVNLESKILLTKMQKRIKDMEEPRATVSSLEPIPVPILTRVVPSQDSQIFTRIQREFKIVMPRNAEEKRPRALVCQRKLSPSRVKLKSAKPPTLELATNPSPPPTQPEIMTKRSLPVSETHVVFQHHRYAHAATMVVVAQYPKDKEDAHLDQEEEDELQIILDIIIHQ